MRIRVRGTGKESVRNRARAQGDVKCGGGRKKPGRAGFFPEFFEGLRRPGGNALSKRLVKTKI